MDEFVDELDSNAKPTGRVITKSFAHENKIFHGEVNVFVINKKKELLLQKRSRHKKSHPGLWGGLAGHVESGETFETAALREIYEEIGVKLKRENLVNMGLEKWIEDYQRAWMQLYLAVIDKPESAFTPQPDEVECVKWFTLDEFQNRVDGQIMDSVFHLQPQINKEAIRFIENISF